MRRRSVTAFRSASRALLTSVMILLISPLLSLRKCSLSEILISTFFDFCSLRFGKLNLQNAVFVVGPDLRLID